MIGTKLAQYEITNHLGTGGMGEVYQAADTKLGRDVAIKLLPAAFAQDSDRVARFKREARMLASLNHPNIAAIYDLEEGGGQNFLVMELVPGETLAQRIKRGAMPVPEALGIAGQILEALEAAHEKGIVHRDLKPANIKVTAEGRVKVLDFGLAKAFEADPANVSLSNSPTMSIAATQQGVILGTAAYMSPEQAKGRAVDQRADIFAFGCVLYEMLAGRPAFDGDDVQDILSAVLRSEPDWTKLPAGLPPPISRLLRVCLQKDIRERRQTATDVRIDMKQALVEPALMPTAQPARRSRLSWIAAAAAGLVAVALGIPAARHLNETPPTNPLLRLSVELGADAPLAMDRAFALALSPDGTVLVFVGSKAGEKQLYLRRLGQLQSTPIAGTSGASGPFFSPNGEWIAFYADGKLKKIPVTGGAATTLADAPGLAGGSWGDDDNIVFNPTNSNDGSVLMRVSSKGGAVEQQTKLLGREGSHRWPQVLPGARAILFISLAQLNSPRESKIMVQPLPDGTPRVVLRDASAVRYLPSGHLVYAYDGTLHAAPFSLDQLAVTGPSVPVVEGVAGDVQFATSDTGGLVYVPGQRASREGPISWMDRDGKITSLHASPSDWSNPQFSPDGRKLAIDIFDGKQGDVWIDELTRDNLTKLTLNAANDFKPLWTPDGLRIVFASNRGDKAAPNLYWQRADGVGDVQRLTESGNIQNPGSWDPSGKFLAFRETNAGGDDLMILPMDGDEASGWKPGKPEVFLNTSYNENEPMFSPDGRWIAYSSFESGTGEEVFVLPFRRPGGKSKISTNGGNFPTWSPPPRQELYYKENGKIMSVSYVVEGDLFKADTPRQWSKQAIRIRAGRSYDFHPESQRFAVSERPETPPAAPPDKAVFIFNFLDELRRLAPPAKH